MITSCKYIALENMKNWKKKYYGLYLVKIRKPVSHCWSVIEAHVALITTFSLSVFYYYYYFGSGVSHLPLGNIPIWPEPHRFSLGYRSHGQQTIWLASPFGRESASPQSLSAGDMATQIITDRWNVTADFKHIEFCAPTLFLHTIGLLFSNEVQNWLSSKKRSLDHWATVHWCDSCSSFPLNLWPLNAVALNALTPASFQLFWSSA